jgi:GWxTD domain-containing protein
MLKNPFMMLILISLLWGPGFSQVSFIPLNVDHALFRSIDQKALLELYLSVSQDRLRYVEADSGFVAQFTVHKEISISDSVIVSSDNNYQSFVNSLDEIESKHQFTNVYYFELSEGRYTVTISVNDLNSSATGEYIFPVYSEPFVSNEPAMSDIEFCSKILRDSTRSNFRKASLQVIPNPSSMYGISVPILYYYAEMYNLEFSNEGDNTFRQECYISDQNGEIVKLISDKIKQKPGSSSILVGGSNVVDLPANTYFFNLKVTDLQSGKSAHKTKRFTLIKPSTQPGLDTTQIRNDSNNILAGIYMNYGEKDLDREFERLKYISSKEEKNLYQHLDVQGRREFLTKFWGERDTDPCTLENEFRKSYFERLEYASQHFGAANKEGWETDRGRILLTYGIPDNIERFLNVARNKPHEIWSYYNIEGGVIFIFADLYGFGNYELIHSTHTRELKQPNWKRLISPGARSVEVDSLF